MMEPWLENYDKRDAQQQNVFCAFMMDSLNESISSFSENSSRRKSRQLMTRLNLTVLWVNSIEWQPLKLDKNDQENDSENWQRQQIDDTPGFTYIQLFVITFLFLRIREKSYSVNL